MPRCSAAAVCRRVHRDDAALIHDGDAITKTLGFFDVMSCQQYGAFLSTQLFEQRMNLGANLGIKTSGGLVQKK